jgi:hypothetical protein
MITIGSGKQLYIGGMILAALLLLAYNGFTLMSLHNPKILGRSIEAKLASQKWQELEIRELSDPGKTLADLDLNPILSKFTRSYHDQIERMKLSVLKKEPELEAIIEEIKPEEEETVQIRPPNLKGIVRISDVQGNIYSVAIIEGERFQESEIVQGFTVQQITDKGVVLTKSGKSWFVPAPEVHYSVDQGG